MVAEELGPVVEEESVAVQGEVLAHQCQPPDLPLQRPAQRCPQRSQTSAVPPTSVVVVVVLATGLTSVMRRGPEQEQQAARAIAPLSIPETALKSDRGLTLVTVQEIDLVLEPARATTAPEPTDRKLATSPLVAIAPAWTKSLKFDPARTIVLVSTTVLESPIAPILCRA